MYAGRRTGSCFFFSSFLPYHISFFSSFILLVFNATSQALLCPIATFFFCNVSLKKVSGVHTCKQTDS